MRLDLLAPGQLTFALTPDLALMVGAMALLLYAAWRPATDAHQRRVGMAGIALTVATLALVALFAFRGYTSGPGVIAVDNFRWASDAIFLLGALLTLPLAIDYQRREGIVAPESHVLVLLATSGMMLLGAARDLAVVFLGIELMSISVYVLTALNRRSARSAEGALKYFLLGAFSTAFLLYGMALVYGATGSTNFAVIGERLANDAVLGSPMLKIGIALLVVGFGFKVAAVPFHVWAPDVYEGAPTPHTAFMAASVKAAAFAAFLRLFVEAFPAALQQWHLVVWWLATATMVVGNVVALAQRNIKRLLAYSSVAHAGYILVAVVVGTGQGPDVGVTGSSAFLFYLFAYTLATMGAFAVVCALGPAGERDLDVQNYSGLWTVRPGLTLAMSVYMLALLGFPVFGGIGFFAKWYMLQAALRGLPNAPQTYLAIVLVVTSVISAGYYLYVVTVMFMRPRAEGAPTPSPVGGLTNGVIVATVALILIFGFAPTQILRGVTRSALQPAGQVAGPAAAGSAAAPTAVARTR
jgi:NADH-quinone oxidoreductase subunit N